MQFISVAPCRIVDTRYYGAKTPISSTTRSFDTHAWPATSLTYQGGNSAGCGIPAYARAVQVNIGVKPVNSAGYVKGWAYGAPEPNASLLNFNKSDVANMVTIPVAGGAANEFNIKVVGTAHVFIDVAGYYVNPLYASIAKSGAVYNNVSSGLVSSTKVSTGYYELKFERRVRGCIATVNDIQFIANADVSADPGFDTDPNTVAIQVVDNSNMLMDTFFSVHLTC